MASETETPTEQEEEENSRKMDPEIRLIGQMLRDLQNIDEAGRVRIVSYIASRYKAS